MTHLLFHRIVDLADAYPQVVVPSREHAIKEDLGLDFMEAYEWLSHRIGHWPFFVAVGTDNTIAHWGYRSQFNSYRWSTYPDKGSVYERIPRGEFESKVLISFADLQDVTFSNFNAWHWLVNAHDRHNLTAEQERKLLRPERAKENWLHAVQRPDGPVVQGHVPQFDPSAADRIWCRSKVAKKTLVERGFDSSRIEVVRLPAL